MLANIRREWLLLGAVIAFLAYLLFAVRPHAQQTILGPIITNTVVGTSAVQIIGTNPSRKAITICNSSNATNNIAIVPSPLTPTAPGATGLGVPLAAAASGFPNCFSSPGGTQSVGQAWNGISNQA